MVLKKIHTLMLVSMCLVLSYCSDENSKQKDDNHFSFYSLNDNNKVYSNIIGLKHQSFGSEFLVQASLIFQPVIPRFQNLKSRIVIFKKIDDFVYMIEEPDGHSITNQFSQKFVITKFPIVSKDESTIYFDFVQGMKKVFVTSDWYAPDLNGDTYKADSWDSATIDVSYISERQITPENGLVLEQVAQVLAPNGTGQLPVKVKYYITPYKNNPNFTPSYGTNFEHMGFFEISPKLQYGGNTVRFATKFDINKPITFYISSNTPSEYKDAVKDGILYWNKAFGFEALKVFDAPKGVTAPDFKHNIVQWVDWNDAGFAYADAQMDPRTGEILHAQIFLTSVFAFSSKARAKALLKRIQNQKHHEQEDSHNINHKKLLKKALKNHFVDKKTRVSLSGFKSSRLCDFHINQKFLDQLSQIVNSEAKENNEKILKISQDYVREVVAHEVGHTLGLRHNFAGSLHANYPESTKNIIYKEYLENGKVPDNITTSSSVMDYQSFKEGTMTGDMVLRKEKPFEYDKIAIQSLYNKKSYPKHSTPLYCTDTHIGKFLDCKVFDNGANLIDIETEKSILKHIPFALSERFIRGVALKNQNKIDSLDKVLPDIYSLALNALSGRIQALNALKRKTPLLKIRRSITGINSLTKPFVKTLERNYIKDSFAKVGGIEYVFRTIDKDFVEDMKKRFDEIIQKESFRKQKTEEGYEFQINDNDFSKIKILSTMFFVALPLAFKIAEIIILNEAENLADTTLVQQLKNIIKLKVQETVLSHKMETLHGIKIPIFTYPHEIRRLAASLLDDRCPENKAWGLTEKKEIRRVFKKALDLFIGEDIFKIDLASLPEKIAHWAAQNTEVLQELM